MKSAFKNLFEKYMFWVVLSYSIVYAYLEIAYPTTWDLNRTIGWGWDITNIFFWNAATTLMLFLFGYFVVFITKRRNLLYLSVPHTFLIFFGEIFTPHFSTESGALIAMLIGLMSWMIFLLNLVLSRKDV